MEACNMKSGKRCMGKPRLATQTCFHGTTCSSQAGPKEKPALEQEHTLNRYPQARPSRLVGWVLLEGIASMCALVLHSTPKVSHSTLTHKAGTSDASSLVIFVGGAPAVARVCKGTGQAVKQASAEAGAGKMESFYSGVRWRAANCKRFWD